MAAGSRALLLGGEPFAKPVSLWWNFVAFDKNAFAVARQAWENGDVRFGPVGDGSAHRLKAPSLPVSP